MSQIHNVNTSQVNLPQEPMNTSSVEQGRSSRMSEVAQDVKAGEAQPPRVHRSAASIVGRVLLSIVTLGISEAVIAIVNKVRSSGSSPANEANTLQEARASNLEQAPAQTEELQKPKREDFGDDGLAYGNALEKYKAAQRQKVLDANQKANAPIETAVREGNLPPEYEEELSMALHMTQQAASKYIEDSCTNLSHFPYGEQIRDEIAYQVHVYYHTGVITPQSFREIVEDAINQYMPKAVIDKLAEQHQVSPEFLLAFDKQFEQALANELEFGVDKYGNDVKHLNEYNVNKVFVQRMPIDKCKELYAHFEKGVQTLRTELEKIAQAKNTKLDEKIVERAVAGLKKGILEHKDVDSYLSRDRMPEIVNAAVEKQLTEAQLLI